MPGRPLLPGLSPLREFVFVNPLRFWAEGRPDFFKGTALQSEAAEALRDAQPTRSTG